MIEMKEFIYRLLSRKKYLLKSCLILSLLVFTSMVVVFLPQLAGPHILNKYLANFTTGSEYVSDQSYNDFDFYIKSRSPIFLTGFNETIELISQEVFGINEVNESKLFTFNTISILNYSISEAYLIGITAELYQTINEFCSFISTSGAILLSPFQNETFGNYYISFRNNETILPVSNKIEELSFTSEFRNLYEYLSGLITSVPRFFFIQIDELIDLFDGIVKNSSPPTYALRGFIRFSQFQRDIMYWSKNSEDMLSQFEEELLKKLLTFDSSVTLELQYSLNGENILLVKLVYTFLNCIQFLMWGISFVLTVLTIKKLQATSKNQELRTLFAGKKWGHRLSFHLLESLILVVLSCCIALSVLYPFIKLQLIFEINFSFSIMFLWQFILIFGSFLAVLFLTYLDYEFYLRRIINQKSKNSEYKPYNSIPKYIKLLIPLVILLIVWLFDRSIFTLIIYLSFIFITLIISYLSIAITRVLLILGMRFYHKRKDKHDKPLSLNYILLKLWNKQLISKLFIYTFVLASVSSIFLFVNFTADAKRSEYLWSKGSEIEFLLSANNITDVDKTLTTISKIIDSTKIIYFGQYSKGDEHYSYTLVDNVITEVNSSYMGERIDHIIGINYTDYFKFYKSWNKNNWLIEGDFGNLAENVIFISKVINSYGIGINDLIEFINSSYAFNTQGIINAWPSITDQKGQKTESEQIFIMDFNFIQEFLNKSNISYSILYKIHTLENDIKTVINEFFYLIPDSILISELNYLDTEVFIGIRKVFLNPLLILFQLIFLFWGALFIYSNFEDKIFSSQTKQVGIIALTNNYKQPLLFYQNVEGLILYIVFFIIFGLLFIITYGILQATDLIYGIKSIMISRYTILNIILLLLCYPVLLILQAVSENRKLSDINLSLLYQHSE